MVDDHFTNNQKTALSAMDLCVIRGGRILFEHLSFQLFSGQAMELTGVNGSGKTSLLRVLSGIAMPYQGDVLLQNQSLLQNRSLYRLKIGFLSHQDAMKKDLTLYENLRFWADLYGVLHEDLEIAMDQLSLSKRRNQLSGELSFGLMRRLALARLAMLKSLPLWLMDEPLSGLDTSAKDDWTKLVESYLSLGGMAIIASHEPLPLPISQNLTISLA